MNLEIACLREGTHRQAKAGIYIFLKTTNSGFPLSRE